MRISAKYLPEFIRVKYELGKVGEMVCVDGECVAHVPSMEGFDYSEYGFDFKDTGYYRFRYGDVNGGVRRINKEEFEEFKKKDLRLF